MVHWDEATAKKFGRALRRLREERQMSQEALAFQAGVTKNQVQLIESGRASGRKDAAGPSNPRMSTLVGLAAVLSVSVSDMLESADL
ncbi:XRE family transcriptional regulator [Amycolatopsis sp. A1MSW2902]